MEKGKKGSEKLLEARIRNQAPNKCCTLIYTVSRMLRPDRTRRVWRLGTLHLNQAQSFWFVRGGIIARYCPPIFSVRYNW